MPLINRREFVQLSLLLLCVPLQYFICSYWSFDSKQRDYVLTRFVQTASDYKARWLTLESWVNWSSDLVINIQNLWDNKGFHTSTTYDSNVPGESPAVEVMRFKNKDGYFGASPNVRFPKPMNVKFRVGQTVTHKTWKYRGVIIGWDEIAKAPEAWLNTMHPPDKKHWRLMPNYAVLVDSRDRKDGQITYVPQENLEVIVDTKIKNGKLEDFFYQYDGAVYLPRGWLKALYPAD